MPLRYAPLGAVPTRSLDRLASPPSNAASFLFRAFHTSRKRPDDADDSDDHYETLGVHPNATHTEIKKSFYRLSKLHHPDMNPSDPHAPRKFHRISEAYHVLSHAEKRARYDRDFFRRHPHHHHNRAHKATTYSGPAGGRPASGLSSRRRSPFQGPPPSFYRSGGWGAQSSKRRAAHQESTGSPGSRYHPESNTGHNSRNPNPSSSGETGGEAGTTGGMGPGQRPYPQQHNWFGGGNDTSHFDKEGHGRTHRRADERRATKKRRKGAPGEDGAEEEGDWGRLMVVSGALVFAMVGPACLIWSWDWFTNWIGGSGGSRRKKPEGS